MHPPRTYLPTAVMITALSFALSVAEEEINTDTGAPDNVTAAEVDLDVDSDNQHGFMFDGFTETEDNQETTAPGKYVFSTAQMNSDGDQVPDFADGFNLNFSDSAHVDELATVTSSLKFVPVEVKLVSGFVPANTWVTFTYAATRPKVFNPGGPTEYDPANPTVSPGGIVVTGTGTAEDPYLFGLREGGMRLWQKSATERTSGNEMKNATPDVDTGTTWGDFVPTGKKIKWTDLETSTGVARLYLEYVDTNPPQMGGVTSIGVDAIQEGSYPPVSASDGVKVTLLPLDLAVDTDRNEVIEPAADAPGKARWTDKRGAIYSVNFDRDRVRTIVNTDLGDAITWWDTPGVPAAETWTIDNDADIEDITPFEIRVPDLPPGAKVYLTVPKEEDLHAMHVFASRVAGAESIWGSYGDNHPTWTDSDANTNDIEITPYLRPPVGEGGPDDPPSGVKAGTYEFGLEGLLFRGMKVPGGTLPNGGFGGIIELGLDLEMPGPTGRHKLTTIQTKVAPFLLTHNGDATDHVFVGDNGYPDGLQDKGMPSESKVNFGLPDGSLWMQDHVEIGYTQRPGGPLTKLTFVCPYSRGNTGMVAKWPQYHLLEPDKGIFGLGSNVGEFPKPGPISGNYGGNIELSYPEDTHPLGRILVGDTMTPELQSFLNAQEKQELTPVGVSYAAVHHIDEVISFGPNGANFKPAPAAAITLLENEFPTPQDKLEGVFFTTDNVRAKVTTVFASTPDSSDPGDPTKNDVLHVVTALDYEAAKADWLPYVGGFARVVGNSGASGQVAWISSIEKAVPGDAPGVAGVAGKLKIKVNRVCYAGVGSDWSIPGEGAGSPTQWVVPPQKDDKLVVVKETLFWADKEDPNDSSKRIDGKPAFITVRELLDHAPFRNHNQTTLPPLIEASVTAADIRDTVGLPCLYHNAFFDFRDGRVSFSNAFTPAAINLQWDKNVAVVPKQYGPRNALNEDVFEKELSRILGADTLFIDNWKYFHIFFGEVHCGSAAERTPENSWWTK